MQQLRKMVSDSTPGKRGVFQDGGYYLCACFFFVFKKEKEKKKLNLPLH